MACGHAGKTSDGDGPVDVVAPKAPQILVAEADGARMARWSGETAPIHGEMRDAPLRRAACFGRMLSRMPANGKCPLIRDQPCGTIGECRQPEITHVHYLSMSGLPGFA